MPLTHYEHMAILSQWRHDHPCPFMYVQQQGIASAKDDWARSDSFFVS